MRQPTRVAMLTLGIVMLALLLTTASYAKLVVLSASFNNSNEGFAPSTSNNCGASFNVNPSTNGLQVTTSSPTGCAGTFQIDKLVVLSPIGHPSFEVAITDPGRAINTAASAVVVNGQSYSMTWDSQGSRYHGSAKLAALNGQTAIRMVIRFNAGTRNFVINNVMLSSN